MEEVTPIPRYICNGAIQTIENVFNRMWKLTTATLGTLFFKHDESKIVYTYHFKYKIKIALYIFV